MKDVTCESIKEKILLCEELTDAEKEHIANCEECRAASLQTEKMINDLAKMYVPDIKDGELADRVMNEIRDSKIFHFPKFKLSNHIGTAAALVIVVAMFAAVKLSDNARLDANNASDMSDSGKFVMLTDSYDGASESAEDETVPEVNAKFMALDAVKETTSDDSDVVQNSAVEEKSQKLKFALRATSDEEQKFEDTNAVETDSSDSLEEDVPQMSLYATNSPSMAGGAGGSGGGASAVKDFGEAIFEESVSVEAEEAEEAEKLFSSDLFDEENTLEENVNAANEYVISIYEDANIIKLSTLNEMQITNEVFLAWINTVETVGEYTFETLYSFVQNNN